MTLLVTYAMALMGCADRITNEKNQPHTVNKVDLNKYMGRWYEIASYPQWFEKEVTNVSALYSINKKGYVAVMNSGFKNGRIKTAHGKAKIADTNTNAKLKVSFFGPFYAPYWIIELSDHYSWAVISNPKRKTLWILSRQPTMDEMLYEEICSKLHLQGFDLSKLVRMVQQL